MIVTAETNAATLPVFSVVVCTYNRADLVADVLQSLIGQRLVSSHFEIIVVDNNSTDETKDVVNRLLRSCSNLRYVMEARQGLSNARNRGWREAKGNYVAYVDDDCMMPEQWLKVAYRIVKDIAPGVFGGPFFPFYNSPKARWFKDAYGSHQPFDKAQILTGNERLNIFGGNMFFRRDLLERTGGFDPKLGMCGNKIAYSEETVLIQQISDSMPDEKFYFDPDLYLFHLVAPVKMKLKWHVKSRFSLGRYGFYTSEEWERGTWHRVDLKGILYRGQQIVRNLAKDLLRGLIFRNQKQYPFVQNYLKEKAFDHLYLLGVLYEKYLQSSNEK